MKLTLAQKSKLCGGLRGVTFTVYKVSSEFTLYILHKLPRFPPLEESFVFFNTKCLSLNADYHRLHRDNQLEKKLDDI